MSTKTVATDLEAVTKATEKLGAAETVAQMKLAGFNKETIKQVLELKKVSPEIEKTALSTKKATTATVNFTGATRTLTFGMKAAEVGAKALKVALSTIGGAIVGALISETIGYIYSLITKQKELTQAAKESAQEFGNNSKEINNYADRYQKLHAELLNANTTEERQIQIKNELLSIQTELNEKYGEEYGKLDLVTNKYKDQTEAIKNLNKELAEDLLYGKDKEKVNEAISEMEEKRDYNLGAFSNNAKSSNAIKELAKEHGLETFEVSGNMTAIRLLDVNAEEALKKIKDFRNELNKLQENSDFNDNWIDNLLNGAVANNEKMAQKTVDDYSVTYHKAIEARIIDNDELNRTYTDLIESANAYNEALESGDEKAIEDARKAYDEAVNAIDWDSENMQGGVGEYFKNAKETAKVGIQDFKNYLQTEGSNLLNPLKGMTEADLITFNNNDELDVFDPLMESAEKCGLEFDDVVSILKELGVVQSEVVEDAEKSIKQLSYKDTISELDKYTKQLNTLEEVYNKFADGNKDTNITFEDLSSLNSNFADISGIENYIRAIQEAKGNADATQNAFNDLATAYVKHIGILDQVNEGNADLIVTYLEEEGIVNANELVYSQLEAKMLSGKLAVDEYKNATADSLGVLYSQVSGLLAQGDATGIATTALFQLIAQQTIFQNTSLNTSQKIQELEKLAKSFGVVADSAAIAKENAQFAANYRFAASNGASKDQLEAMQEQHLNALGSEYYDAIEAKFGNISAKYDGGGNVKPSNGSKNKDKGKDKETIDWIERKLELLEKERSNIENVANSKYISYLNSIGLTEEEVNRGLALFDKINAGMELTAEEYQELGSYANKSGISINNLYDALNNANFNTRQNAFAQLIENDKKQIDTATQAVEQYKNNFESVKNLVSPEILDKIQNGSLDISEYSDEEKKNIDKVIDANDKYLNSITTLQEKETQLNDDINAKYDDQIKYLDQQNDLLEGRKNLIQSQIEYLNATGQLVNTTMYESVLASLRQQESFIEQKLALKRQELEELLKNNPEDSEAILDIKGQILDIEEALVSNRTEQANVNDEIERLPIDRLAQAVDMYNNLTSSIEAYGAALESAGKKLDEDYYQSLISNGEQTIDKLQEQADLIKELRDDQEVGSEKWHQLNNELQSVNSSMSSIVQNMNKWNEEILNMPLNHMSELKDQLGMMSDALSNVQDDYKTVIDTVIEAIDREKEKLQEIADEKTESLQNEIDKKQEQLDLLEEENNKLKLQQNLEKALLDLENAIHQKTVRVKGLPEYMVTYRVLNINLESSYIG